MALYPPQDGEKLIFAPSSTAPLHGQAEQFMQHELLGLRRADLDPASPIGQFHAWFKTALDPSSSTPSAGAGAAAAAVATTTVKAKVSHPETCTLSTASLPSGRVSARIVYMKELDHRGFVIHSNFGTSRKAADLFGSSAADGSSSSTGATASTGNPWAALTFWWESQERQVRVEGRAERLSPEESQRYFDTRVRGSRIGAWASRQSAVLKPLAATAATTTMTTAEGAAAAGGADGDDDGRAQLDGWVRETEERFRGVDNIPVPEFWGGLRIVPVRVEFWQGRQNRLHDRFVYERASEEDEQWTLERLSP